MNIQDLPPPRLEKASFLLQKKILIPATTGLYILHNFSGEVLYIGHSNNLQRRFGEHIYSTKKQQMTPSGKVFWFSYGIHKQAKDLEKGFLAQAVLMDGYLPYFNSILPPC